MSPPPTEPVFRLNLRPADPCPCGRNAALADCCRTPDGRVVPGRTSTPKPAGDGRHPRCYARSMGGCSEGLTLEHYMSRSVLEALETEGHLSVDASGMKPFKTSAARIGGRVLCKAHNNALDPLDRVGKAFFVALGSAPEHLKATDQPARRVRLVNGHDVERWLLKTLCGFVATFKEWAPPERWLRVLFGEVELGAGEGLYLDVQQREQQPGPRPRMIRLERIDDRNDVPCGLVAHLETLRFGLAMTPGMFKGLHRPLALRAAQDGRESVQLLGWDSPLFNMTVTFTWSL